MSKLLEIKELYGGYQKGVKVLRGINMHIEQGEAVGILGLNGSGKSTLGKAVMNLLPYRSGTIIFDGQDVSAAPTHKLAKMGIAMMHQGGTVFNNLSVWQNLQLAFGIHVDKEYYNQLLEIIPLLKRPQKELMRTMADRLSGGQRHELALAMTLARKPKLVILDEPSAGLSPQAIREMYSNGELNQQKEINSSAMCPKSVSQINGILVEVKQQLNISILLIEQNVSLAQSFCDRCVMLEQGRIADEFIGERLNINVIEKVMFNK